MLRLCRTAASTDTDIVSGSLACPPQARLTLVTERNTCRSSPSFQAPYDSPASTFRSTEWLLVIPPSATTLLSAGFPLQHPRAEPYRAVTARCGRFQVLQQQRRTVLLEDKRVARDRGGRSDRRAGVCHQLLSVHCGADPFELLAAERTGVTFQRRPVRARHLKLVRRCIQRQVKRGVQPGERELQDRAAGDVRQYYAGHATFGHQRQVRTDALGGAAVMHDPHSMPVAADHQAVTVVHARTHPHERSAHAVKQYRIQQFNVTAAVMDGGITGQVTDRRAQVAGTDQGWCPVVARGRFHAFVTADVAVQVADVVKRCQVVQREYAAGHAERGQYVLGNVIDVTLAG